MNGAQKLIVGLGLFAIAVTTIVAPYEISGHNRFAAVLRNRAPDSYPFSGTMYAPLWSAPDKFAVATHAATLPGATIGTDAPSTVDPITVRLATDRLMLWWLGIAIVTAAAAALASGRSAERHSSSAAETAR